MSLIDEIVGLGGPRLKGRAHRPVVDAQKLRELTPADLALLELEGNRTTSASKPIARLNQRHHGLARALAGGMKDTEAAIVTGYDPSRISILKGDPTFRALVDFYRENLDKVFSDLHEKMAGLSAEAADRLRDLLENDENVLSASVLLDILKATADRTGYAPKTQVEVKTLHLTPDDLRRLKDETNETHRVRIVGGSDDRGAAVLLPSTGQPLATDAPERCKGEGEDIREKGWKAPPEDAASGPSTRGAV